MSRERGRTRRRRFQDDEDVNPMNYIQNLSDVMLLLAVGIMLALILHWNVNISAEDKGTGAEESSSQAGTLAFTDDELQDVQSTPDDMQRMGDVYYDEKTGTYYIVKSQTQGTEP